jgi:hypothetical protein
VPLKKETTALHHSIVPTFSKILTMIEDHSKADHRCQTQGLIGGSFARMKRITPETFPCAMSAPNKFYPAFFQIYLVLWYTGDSLISEGFLL